MKVPCASSPEALSVESTLLLRLHHCLDSLPDPRVARTKLHPLKDILLLTIAAVLCLADGFEQTERWAKVKGVEWLRENLGLELPHGIPHHDTFRRVLTRLPPTMLHATIQNIFQQMAPEKIPHIAIDGKEVRGSFDAQEGAPALQLLHAFATEQRLLLACKEIDSKSNEIPAARDLVRQLKIEGAVVSADAMHCQTQTAAAIVAGKGDYVLAVKDNQKTLHEAIDGLFLNLDREEIPFLCAIPCETHRSVEKNRGRIEERVCRRVLVKDWLGAEDIFLKRWPKLTSVLCLERCRRFTRRGEQIHSRSRLFFISSRSSSAFAHQGWIRGHWEVENGLHLVLDVTFGEDGSRVRKNHAPSNLALIRRLVLNLVRATPSNTVSVRGRRQEAAWSDAKLLQILKF